MDAQDLADGVTFLATQAAHLAAGELAALNGWFALGCVGLVLAALPSLVDWLHQHARGLTRLVIDGGITALLFAAYFIGMLAYGIFWVWLFVEIGAWVSPDDRLYVAVGLGVAALVPVVWLVRACGEWFAAIAGGRGPRRDASRGPAPDSR